MNIEPSENNIIAGSDPVILSELFQNVFSSLEEILKTKDEQNQSLNEICQLLSDLFPLVDAFKTQKHESLGESDERIHLKFNKSLLVNLFYLIGKEEDNTQTQTLIRLLLIMMSKDSYLVSPLSWENLFSIIEEEIITGNNTSETFRGFSKIFYLLPSNGVKRLFGDFFDYMKTLLESFLEEPLSLLPSLFKDILHFLISTKLNVAFQQKLANSEVHLIFYKILKSLFELENVDHALSSVDENRELLIQIIVNCLSVADTQQHKNFINELLFHPTSRQLKKFENEILGPLLYTSSVTNLTPLLVNFKDENYLFGNFNENLDVNDFIHEQPEYIDDDLFKKILNLDSSPEVTTWKKCETFTFEPKDFTRANGILIEMHFRYKNTQKRLIALITSGLHKADDHQIKTNQSTGNFLFIYENKKLYLLLNDMNILIEAFDSFNFQLKILCQDFKIAEVNNTTIETIPILFESSSILQYEKLQYLEKSGTIQYLKDDCFVEVWSSFKIMNVNRFDKNVLSQFESFFSQKKNSLFLLPSKLTLEEFLLIIMSNNPEYISSLRLSLNGEKVGIHTKLEDLIHKEKSNCLEITIKLIDGIVDTIPLLSPGEVLKAALAKISYQPWTLISRCSYLFQGNIIFPTLAQMVFNVDENKEDSSLGYKTLAKEFGILIEPLESLFGVQLYNLFFWFIFDSKSIDQKLKLVWQTILQAITEKDLSEMEPNEIEILIDNYLETYHNEFGDEYLEAKLDLEKVFEFGEIQNKEFIEPFVEAIILREKHMFVKVQDLYERFEYV